MNSKQVNPTIVNEVGVDISGKMDKVYYSPAYPKKAQLRTLQEAWSDSSQIMNSNPISCRLTYRISVLNNGVTIFDTGTISVGGIGAINEVITELRKVPTNNNGNSLVDIKSGNCNIVYEIQYSETYASTNYLQDFTATYDLYITENTEPLPKWNAWTVCERMLNIAETIRQGDKPRFKLDPTQREWLESIETPEFQFTQSTLRECLQGVGSFIHAEPRLLPNEDNDGYQGIVHFDKYGGNEESEFDKTYKEYASKSVSRDLSSFATNIDSSVDNFVNSINYASSGTLVEPYVDGYKTVLAESSYVRITDSNMYIATQYPIRSIKSLKFGYDYSNDWQKVDLDITPNVFESAEYQQLSSYETQYPTSKAYAVYYTIGEKGIHGLNFKQEDLFGAWKNYAIKNIIESALSKSIDSKDYWRLNFQVEYVPIYPARVQQNKSIIDLNDIGKEWTKPYNQGQNLIETQYYGENLKGVIARMGNIDKTVTYVIPEFPSVLPKIGELYDDNYYISSSAVEVQPYYTKITLALSKDFNKYNEYVGVNSTKRMYEISERQAFDSEITYREFCVFADIGDNSIKDSKNTLLDNTPKEYYSNILKNLFIQNGALNISATISYVNALGFGDKGEPLNQVVLPVIRSSFGNACVLSFKYEDNYSAGNYSKRVENTGFFVETAPYTDVYGRIKSLRLNFISKYNIEGINPEDFLRYPPTNDTGWLDGTTVILKTGNYPIIIEKGNAEALSFNYQLEFVSTREDIIIGSGLAKNISLVKDANNNNRAKLYYFNKKLNKFDLELDIKNAIEDNNFKALTITTNMFEDDSTNFKAYNPNLPQGTSYKSWALVAPFEVKDGNSTKTVYQLLIGCNMTIDSSTTNIFAGNGHKGLKMCIVAEKDLYK